MLIDNKSTTRKNPITVFDFFKRYLARPGKFRLVTGYFSASGLTRFYQQFDDKISEYQMVIGDLAKVGEEKDKLYNLLSDNLTMANGVNTFMEQMMPLNS